MTDKTTIINNDDLFKRISSNLKKLIKVMNWSQKQLAEMTGLTSTSISNIEGDKPCSVSSLTKICDALNINLAFTQNDTEDVVEVDDVKSKIVNCCNQLNSIKEELIKLL